MFKKYLTYYTSAAILLAGSPLIAEENQPAPASQPAHEEISQDDILRVSEAFGHFIGRNIKSPGVELNLDSIIKGMREGAAGKPAPMNDKDYEALMMRVQESAFKKLSTENLAAANAYLENNAHKASVIIIEPGKLQYTITHSGTGEAVAEHASPQIQYTGKYIDGTVFGSSADTGGPITIPLDQTIPGFSKGIVGMKEGEKRLLFVHPDLGYGTSGHLAPNSLLIFEVEVIKADTPKAAQAETDGDVADAAFPSDDDGMDDDEDDEDDIENEDDEDQ